MILKLPKGIRDIPSVLKCLTLPKNRSIAFTRRVITTPLRIQ